MLECSATFLDPYVLLNVAQALPEKSLLQIAD